MPKRSTEPKVRGSNPLGRAGNVLLAGRFLFRRPSPEGDFVPNVVSTGGASGGAVRFRFSGHVFRREAVRGPVRYARYRLGDGRRSASGASGRRGRSWAVRPQGSYTRPER